MTPSMVHYGSVPESTLTIEMENLRRILDTKGRIETESLTSLKRICVNAMKQYRKTRPNPSKNGLKEAKKILEGEDDMIGIRVKRGGGGGIPCHPVLRYIETERNIKEYSHRCNSIIKDNENKQGQICLELDNSQWNDTNKRNDFLCAISRFRPKETVLETSINPGEKTVCLKNQIVQLNKQYSLYYGSKVGLSAMTGIRRQMKIIRDKRNALVTAGTPLIMEEKCRRQDFCNYFSDLDCTRSKKSSIDNRTNNLFFIRGCKPPISKAERKLLKDKTKSSLILDSTIRFKPKKKDTNFRDPNFYIHNGCTSESFGSSRVEASMQPSAASALEEVSSNNRRLEDSIMDLVSDDKVELVRRQRIVRWDKSKRKYVQMSQRSDVDRKSDSKKFRLESGKVMKWDKIRPGYLYDKWKKKTKKKRWCHHRV